MPSPYSLYKDTYNEDVGKPRQRQKDKNTRRKIDTSCPSPTESKLRLATNEEGKITVRIKCRDSKTRNTWSTPRYVRLRVENDNNTAQYTLDEKNINPGRAAKHVGMKITNDGVTVENNME